MRGVPRLPNLRRLRFLAIAALCLPIWQAVGAQESSVEAIADGVYHYRHGVHSNLFVVTGEGIVVVDPLNPTAARACLAEIRKISDAPIRYVIYSHDHTDHIDGGDAFAGDGVQFVAHRNAPARIAARGLATTVMPDLLVDDEHTLAIGGKTIRLVHPGRVESASALIVHLQEDRVVMWVDAVRSFGAPYRYLEGFDLMDFRAALDEVQNWDFDILIPGHGPPTDKSRVSLFADYLDELIETAEKHMRRYTTADHRSTSGPVNPEKYFDSYIETIAGRVIEELRPTYGDIGGYDDWATKNAERVVVHLLHEIPVFN